MVRGFFFAENFVMKRIRKAVLIVLAIYGSWHPYLWVEASYADDKTYPVYGYVVNSFGAPINGALVNLMPSALTDTTDVNGYFRFERIGPGNYSLTISTSLPGFVNTYRTITVPAPGTSLLRITMSDRTYELDEVVVVSKRPDVQSVEELYPSSVTIMQRSEFEGKSTSVADVIRTMPSITIQSMGGVGDHTELSLRGSNTNQVQIYLDDMLLNEAVGGPVNLSTIPLAHVQSIEVWRSGAPVRYGGDAAGVVNIRTLDNTPVRETFSVGYGSFNTVNANTVFRFPIGMSKALVAADYSSSDNTFPFKSDNGTIYNTDDDFWTYRKNDSYRSFNILSKYHHVIGNNLLQISEHLISSKKQLPGRDIVQQSDASLSTIRNLFQVKLTALLLGDRIEAEPMLYHLHTYEKYIDAGGRVGWGVQDNRYRTNTIRFNSPFTFNKSDFVILHVTPTTDYEKYNPHHKLQTTVPLSCERNHYGLVFDAIVNGFGKRLTISSSIRRDRYHSSYSGQASPVNLIPPEPVTNLMTNRYAGMKFVLSKNLSIRSNYGDAGRVPGFYELSGNVPTSSCKWNRVLIYPKSPDHSS